MTNSGGWEGWRRTGRKKEGETEMEREGDRDGGKRHRRTNTRRVQAKQEARSD